MSSEYDSCSCRELIDWRIKQLQGLAKKYWKYYREVCERLKKSDDTVSNLQWELRKWLTPENREKWSPKIKELEALEKWRWAQLLAALNLMTNEQKVEFDKIDIPDPRARLEDFKAYLSREHGMKDGS